MKFSNDVEKYEIGVTIAKDTYWMWRMPQLISH